MEAFAKALTYAIPFFFILIIIEYGASLIIPNAPKYRSLDTISSLSSGMTNTLKDLLGLSVVIISYQYLVSHLAIVELSPGFWQYAVCFILVDFASYWSHRWNHEINVMWDRHIVHHSSEEFNLPCALRQSISGIFGVYFFLSIPMALVGIPAHVIGIVAPLHLFAQFWYHTRLIHKMGWLEHIIVTPSHHRVHHAINPEYIDKNYAAIFIVWDKLFGTFKEEDPDIPAVYGVKKAVQTWNPFLINFQHFASLLTDTWRTNSWIDKGKLWFMPTGWRPKDVDQQFPIKVIEDVYSQEKYDVPFSSWLHLWFWIQLVIHTIVIYLMLINIPSRGPSVVILISAYVAVSIFSYTSLMDQSQLAMGSEILKAALGIYITVSYGWFGLDMLAVDIMVLIYLLLSLSITILTLYVQDKTDTNLLDYKPS